MPTCLIDYTQGTTDGTGETSLQHATPVRWRETKLTQLLETALAQRIHSHAGGERKCNMNMKHNQNQTEPEPE
ncbi:MAG: hypothetical protein J07HQW1_01390 [Haloquadratum walsbyi J07HQW1]|uniref:Uncharacterized protein n=1 Tax=Haloquadratum walsbyi J07HQW1 TaxID=1238424 RepID=U1PGV6_9EURY|nr:MAG: hypothetical protein J07HQW1_01390 [Haloquadratum walsbyi J07HQW1]